MSRATYAQFEELVALVQQQTHPIMPKPHWGQDVAYLGASIDRLVENAEKWAKACICAAQERDEARVLIRTLAEIANETTGHNDFRGFCGECGYEWPCPVSEALSAAEEVPA